MLVTPDKVHPVFKAYGTWSVLAAVHEAGVCVPKCPLGQLAQFVHVHSLLADNGPFGKDLAADFILAQCRV
jgi:hypothetical protein